MFSGIQEILVLVIIILGILFLPRILNRGGGKRPAESKPAIALSGKMRMAIAGSVIWPALLAAFMLPWKKDPFLYLYVAIGPIAIIWIVYWVVIGFKKK